MDHDARDTAETLLDSAADAKTIKQFSADSEAATHKLDARAYAPLRVCPQCSLAWESLADWCPSCGTAFDIRDRETEISAQGPSATRVRPGRTGERPAARSPRARRAASSSTRNTGERAAAHAPARRGGQSRAGAAKAPRRNRSGGWAFAIVLLAIIPLAFLIGQQTRQSKAEVDNQIKTAVDQNTRSAVASAQRTLKLQRARLQKQFNDRVAVAEKQAYANGKANAEANLPSSNITDDLKRCLSNFLLDC